MKKEDLGRIRLWQEPIGALTSPISSDYNSDLVDFIQVCLSDRYLKHDWGDLSGCIDGVGEDNDRAAETRQGGIVAYYPFPEGCGWEIPEPWQEKFSKKIMIHTDYEKGVTLIGIFINSAYFDEGFTGTVIPSAKVNQFLEEDDFEAFVNECLYRYQNQDWGDSPEGDCKSNDEAAASGDGSILASYPFPKGKWKEWNISDGWGDYENKIWIRTEVDHSSTMVLFPDEY
jgi:hypothetical protein